MNVVMSAASTCWHHTFWSESVKASQRSRMLHQRLSKNKASSQAKRGLGALLNALARCLTPG